MAVGRTAIYKVDVAINQDIKALIKIPDIHEQNSIAKALDNMDYDISILESRIHKTNSLKQAMMQELLTGRTRLI